MMELVEDIFSFHMNPQIGIPITCDCRGIYRGPRQVEGICNVVVLLDSINSNKVKRYERTI